MPVLIDRDGHRGSGRPGRSGNARDLEIAFVNNMPDPALEATERHFLKLLEAAADNYFVRVTPYTLPGVPHGDWSKHHPVSQYAEFRGIWSRGHDGLIVTGTEPRAPDLADEPYWRALAELIDWTEHETVPAIWSCLAAHAAVRRLDGIRRFALGQKCFGVYDCQPVSAHALTQGVTWPMRVPHSRLNDVPEPALVAAGYVVLARSAEAGVDLFIKQGRTLAVFFQGHPEYQPDTLLREYRRDVGRFLRGEQAAHPALPAGCLHDETARALLRFRDRAVGERRAALIDEFPAVLPRARWTECQPSAITIYRNWLSLVCEQKASLAASGQAQRLDVSSAP
jgi:homoserine O-succinyltransferase